MRPEDLVLEYTQADRDVIRETKHVCDTILERIEELRADSQALETRVNKLENFQAKVVSVSTVAGIVVGYAIHLFK